MSSIAFSCAIATPPQQESVIAHDMWHGDNSGFLIITWHTRPPSHESVARPAPALVCEMQAQLQLQAAVGVRDTIPMSQFLVHHSRLDVPAHTA